MHCALRHNLLRWPSQLVTPVKILRENNEDFDKIKAVFVIIFVLFRSALLTNLQIEREWREGLQVDLEKQKQENTLLSEKVELMTSLRAELDQVAMERDDLRETCHEQELTINDLAGHLGQ